MSVSWNAPIEPEENKKTAWRFLKLQLNDGMIIQHVPHFIFLTFLGLLYIFNNYYADRMVRHINALDKQVDVLRVDYNTLKYDYIYSSKQSEIAEKVKQYGLIENQKPPYRIPLRTDR